MVELSTVELSIFELETAEQFLTVEFFMVELSLIVELSTVELSIVELSSKSQLPIVTTGRAMLLSSSSLEFGWSSTSPSWEVAPEESSLLAQEMMPKLNIINRKTEKILFIFLPIT